MNENAPDLTETTAPEVPTRRTWRIRVLRASKWCWRRRQPISLVLRVIFRLVRWQCGDFEQ